jgi:hypothetical protein
MNLGSYSLPLFFRTRGASHFIASLTMSVLALAALSGTAKANINLITNGGFESTSGITTSNEILNCSTLVGWCSSDSGSGRYNYVYFPGYVTPSDPNGAYTNQDPGQDQCGAAGYVCLWGPSNGPTFPVSPNGGNFVALDADPAYRNALTQSVSGLTVGTTYNLSFDWGGAQYTTRTGPTTEQLIVSLGSQTLNTSVIDNASQSFTGWQPDTMTFTATNTTELLSFLANGTPGNAPPVVVLDGVSMSATPEPSYWAVMVLGLGLLFVAARKRFKSGSQTV